MLRRLAIGTLVLGVLSLQAGMVLADTFTYEPSPRHFQNLPHGKYYTWGIDVSELAGWQIMEAELRVDRITNYNNGENRLYIHMLDEAEMGVHRWNDQNNDWIDAFEGQGVLIDEWSDENGRNERDDLVYVFTDLDILGDLSRYVEDGTLGFGLDPDCHFYNDGFRLVITARQPSTATDNTSWGDIKKVFR